MRPRTTVAHESGVRFDWNSRGARRGRASRRRGAGNRNRAREARAQIYVISEASGADFNGARQLFVICRPAI